MAYLTIISKRKLFDHPSPIYSTCPIYNFILYSDWGSSVTRERSVWEWESVEDRGERVPAAEEVTHPKRLVQQIDAEGELVHDHLDTRAKNLTAEPLVSVLSK